MLKWLVVPLICLLCFSIVVGAFNQVDSTNNRPYTFYEFVTEVSRIKFDVRFFRDCFEGLRTIWIGNYEKGEYKVVYYNGIPYIFNKEDIDEVNGIEYDGILGVITNAFDKLFTVSKTLTSIFYIIHFTTSYVSYCTDLALEFIKIAWKFFTGVPVDSPTPTMAYIS